MPYIPKEERVVVDHQLNPLLELVGEMSTGQLNYVVTRIIDSWVKEGSGVSYGRLNNVMGALECVKQEYYRRVAAVYEDYKAVENGDVYLL